MRIIAKRTLRQFWETHLRGAEAKTQLQVWHSTVKAADWAKPAHAMSCADAGSFSTTGDPSRASQGARFRDFPRRTARLPSTAATTF